MKYGKYVVAASAAILILSSTSANVLATSTSKIITQPTISTGQAFIDEIGKTAMKVATDEGLYASVMLAQAILESNLGKSSLSQAPYYNLFGIKGTFEGKSAIFSTKEDKGNGEIFTIKSNFRQYASYEESLYDYAALVKNGTTYNTNIYAGIWKSNAATYIVATEYLQGRYATDTNYASKLQDLITKYDLTRFDEDYYKVNKISKKIVVKKGDSLQKIAVENNCTVEEILQWNKRTDTTVYIGESLIVYSTNENVKKQEIKKQEIKKSNTKKNTKAIVYKATKYYRVKKGDSLTSIASAHDITTKQLKLWNKLTNATIQKDKRLIVDIVASQKLKTKEKNKVKTYKIQEGDTLSSIAVSANTTEQNLMTLNKLTSEFVYVGQVIKLGK